eukprot:CAMPEP_0118959546 /NCGR_PEP_ID=MMETSP1169-20130426/63183_1 /TAXON_ID=36882 /ORGANISM="Pyramimonas obovata, Strain CCMP722" /LENGTH=521 /DNA_ID=CAMNT_0006907683 /DNA_START=112 /DNA_END=1677 /DNA_ORIENTATION=+
MVMPLSTYRSAAVLQQYGHARATSSSERISGGAVSRGASQLRGAQCTLRQSVCALRKGQRSFVVRAGPSQAESPVSDADQKRELLASTLGGVVTDANVPEGHVGLHSMLYGDGGAEAHDATSVYEIRAGEDDGSTVVSLGAYVEARDSEKPLGVYAVYDAKKEVQYVGYSRNVVVALKTHLKRLGAETCAYTRVMVFANKAMATRANMEAEVKNWIREVESTPPGNAPEGRERWDELSAAVAAQAMSPAELAAYEEKKLKMRKAMGENLFDEVDGETAEGKQRRLNFLQAVEGDDWSGVIDGQTQQTLEEGEAAAAAAVAAAGAVKPADIICTDPSRNRAAAAAVAAVKSAAPIVSPFARATGVGAEAPAELLELTLANADRVLDEVRPYLIADGGNVEVTGVEGGVVAVRLQGACGTCPSSTATMQMGIEKALRNRFGDAMKELVQVDKIDISASIMSVNTHLDVLRPAIKNYGGTIDVTKIEKGVCEVVYTGPPQIAVGITAAIKDKFPDIRDVKFLDA